MRHGHVRLSRALFDGADPLWEEDRPRTKFEAWVDLVQRAAYRPTAYTSVHGTDQLARGEVVASVRYLAAAWQWDKMRVSRYLAAVEKAGRLVRQREGRHGTVYLVVGYDADGEAAPPDETARETAGETPARQPRDTRETKKKQLSSEEEELTATTLGASNGDAPREGTPGDPVAAPHELPPPAPPPPPPDPDPVVVRRNPRRAAAAVHAPHAYDPGFEAAWGEYPRRASNNSKRAAEKAYLARRREGASDAELAAGTRRYAAYCDAKGWTGTEFVKQGATFYGPNEYWAEPWDVPPAALAPGVALAVASGAAPVPNGRHPPAPASRFEKRTVGEQQAEELAAFRARQARGEEPGL